MFEGALLGVHCDSAVVSHMLVTAGSDVEEGGLAAVRVSHQSNLDDLSPLLGQAVHLAFQPDLAVAFKGRQVLL